jgi:beta-glucosidase
LPQALQDKGGWTSRDMLGWFENYAELLCRRFGDRVNNWIIVNEPGVVSWLGHGLGFHAPGLADEKSYLSCVHHLNLVIGRTFRALKAERGSWNVGSSYTLLPIRPESPATDPRVVAHMDGFWNRNFFDPLMRGTYPDIIAEKMMPFIKSGDMNVTRTDLDFVGVQHYNAIEAGRDDSRIFGAFFGAKPDGVPKTDIGWTIAPEGFHECLTGFKKNYGDIPLIVTENGAAFFDTVGQDGKCRDPRRIDFLRGYMAAMHRAMEEGVNIKGYFVWSLMDNFEWSEGYKPRFGLIHVDYANGCRRTPKSSYDWYRQVIAANGLTAALQKAA